MNRDVGRGTDTLQQASSFNYLIYLFVFSASFVVLLPYLFSFSGSVLRSSKKGSITEKVKGQTVKTSVYPSLSSDLIVPRDYVFEDRYRHLEMLVIDLQNTIRIERDRAFQLESELRVLHLSERYLKDRVEKLEDRDAESRRRYSTGSVPIELLMQRTADVQSKQGDLVNRLQELSRMLEAEKQRSNALAVEIKVLRLSESILVDRIKTLEDKFNAFLSKDGQDKRFDRNNEQNNVVQY